MAVSVPLQLSENVSCCIEQRAPDTCRVEITVAAPVVVGLYHNALKHYQSTVARPGFAPGSLPFEYVERNYRTAALEHVRTVVFNAFVIDALVRSLHRAHILTLGTPALESAYVTPTQNATYVFTCNTLPVPIRSGWKQLNFRPPGRKNYRDIDNQVKAFITEEHERRQKLSPDTSTHAIGPLDWVNLCLTITAENGQRAAPILNTDVWLKIGSEEADEDARKLFETVPSHTNSHISFLQDYFDDSSEVPLPLAYTIYRTVPHDHFCFDQFRHQFRLKSTKDVHKKLIEVFSFRHDISQRREMADAALRTLVKEHLISIPRELVEIEMQTLNAEIHANPDYYVYKTKDDFNDQLRKLAHKQLKETAIIDSISFIEKIEVTPEDIVAYLNLLKRPRTTEFVYFGLPPSKLREREFPMSAALVEQACRREKTLNHIITHLSRA